MVKGISKQVIVVRSPDPKLFEQAIFILRDDISDRDCVTDEALMKEADCLMRAGRSTGKTALPGPIWAFAGALLTGAVWILSVLL